MPVTPDGHIRVCLRVLEIEAVYGTVLKVSQPDIGWVWLASKPSFDLVKA